MSEPVPPGGAGRKLGGLPLWGWGVIAAAALGTIVYLRLRSSSAAANSGTAAPPADQQIGLTQYEAISSQLTGIEGTNEALLAAIKDLQGDTVEPPARHRCPKGHHWDEDDRRCVPDDSRDRDDSSSADSGSSSTGGSSGSSAGSAAAAETRPVPARDPGPQPRRRRREPDRREPARRRPAPRRRVASGRRA